MPKPAAPGAMRHTVTLPADLASDVARELARVRRNTPTASVSAVLVGLVADGLAFRRKGGAP